MSKRRKSDLSQSVSLFPFLSILACVIGTLTLMITALALGQMDTDAVASAEQFEQEKGRLEADLARLEQIREKLARAETSADDAQRRLADDQQRLDQLKAELQEAMAHKDDPVELPQPELDTEAHQQRMAQLREQLEQLLKQQAELQRELAERAKPPEDAQVQIQPSGSGTNLKPTFVECNAAGIVIYDGPQPRRVLRADVATDPQFTALLDKIAKNDKDTVVFLVRDNGVGTYSTASNVARTHYARHGKLPVPRKGKIDLSLFGK